MQRFLRLVYYQFFYLEGDASALLHYTKYNTHSVIPINKLKPWCGGVIFNTTSICYARVWHNNGLYNWSNVTHSCSRYHNSQRSLLIVSTRVVPPETCRIFPRDQSVHINNKTAWKCRKIQITRWEKNRFYLVLVKIRIKKSGSLFYKAPFLNPDNSVLKSTKFWY